MSRAKPLPPEARRRTLIEATQPLLATFGAQVSTRQIAEAAGVAEGTIFRVFDSKEALIRACLTDALTHEGLAADVAALPPGLGLEETVTALVTAVARRVESVRALLSVLHHPAFVDPHRSPHHAPIADGPIAQTPIPQTPIPDAPTAGTAGAAHHDPASDDPSHCLRPDPRTLHEQVLDVLGSALEPHADALRVSPREAAATLLALTFGAHHPVSGDALFAAPSTIADLLLHGLSKDL